MTIAGPVNVSTRVTSSVPVVAEGSVYFNADSGLGAPADGGHTVMGAANPATTFNFAEGTVRPGFVEYLTVQNPGPTAGTATLSFQASDDTGTPVAMPDHPVTCRRRRGSPSA